MNFALRDVVERQPEMVVGKTVYYAVNQINKL